MEEDATLRLRRVVADWTSSITLIVCSLNSGSDKQTAPFARNRPLNEASRGP